MDTGRRQGFEPLEPIAAMGPGVRRDDAGSEGGAPSIQIVIPAQAGIQVT